MKNLRDYADGSDGATVTYEQVQETRTYQELGVVVLEDGGGLLRSSLLRRITSSEHAHTLVVCSARDASIPCLRPRSVNALTMDLHHLVDGFKVEQLDALLHELHAPPSAAPSGACQSISTQTS